MNRLVANAESDPQAAVIEAFNTYRSAYDLAKELVQAGEITIELGFHLPFIVKKKNIKLLCFPFGEIQIQRETVCDIILKDTAYSAPYKPRYDITHISHGVLIPLKANFLLLVYRSLRSNTKLTTLPTLCITEEFE